MKRVLALTLITSLAIAPSTQAQDFDLKKLANPAVLVGLAMATVCGIALIYKYVTGNKHDDIAKIGKIADKVMQAETPDAAINTIFSAAKRTFKKGTRDAKLEAGRKLLSPAGQEKLNQKIATAPNSKARKKIEDQFIKTSSKKFMKTAKESFDETKADITRIAKLTGLDSANDAQTNDNELLEGVIS